MSFMVIVTSFLLVCLTHETEHWYDISIMFIQDMKHDATFAAMEAEHEEITKVKNLETIEIGRFQVDTWYYSPYPEEYCVEVI